MKNRYRKNRVYKKKNIDKSPRMRCWKLISDNENIFAKKLNETRVQNVERNINEIWRKVAKYVKSVAKEFIGDSRQQIQDWNSR